jgi:UDP-glucose-4-epimerase GalE
MKPVLVTGGAGYIGSHTCKNLLANGFLPITYDNLSNGFERFVKWGPLEVGDILDTDKLNFVLNKYQPVATIHFAAFAYVGESVHEPLKYYKNNIAGTINLLNALCESGIKNLIFSSTCATYGIPDNNKKISEDSVQKPINPYGFTKLAIEQLLKDLHVCQKINFVNLRYFNAAGADAHGEIGESHDPETHLIPLAIRSVFDPDFILSVFGSNYNTPDGTAIRDYIHVTDLADAHCKALNYLLQSNQSTSLNLGTGKGLSVLEILKGISDLGFEPKYNLVANREGDPKYLVADTRKALEVLGWKAKHSSLNSILNSAINWYQKSMS